MTIKFDRKCACTMLDGPFEFLCVNPVPRKGVTCRGCRGGRHDFYDMRNAQASLAAERAQGDSIAILTDIDIKEIEPTYDSGISVGFGAKIVSADKT